MALRHNESQRCNPLSGSVIGSKKSSKVLNVQECDTTDSVLTTKDSFDYFCALGGISQPV